MSSLQWKRRRVLKLLAGVGGAALGRAATGQTSASAGPSAGTDRNGATVGDARLSLIVDELLRVQVVLHRDGEPRRLTGFDEAETLSLMNGTTLARFPFLDHTTQALDDTHGAGTLHLVRGAAGGVE